MKKIVLALLISAASAGVLQASEQLGEGGFDWCFPWSFNTCTASWDCWYSYSYGSADYYGYCGWNATDGACECIID